jgi:hypothetical protein
MKEQPEIETFTLKIPPGLFTEQTARGVVYQTTVEQYNRIGQGRWKDGNMVRFHNALPQKMGGWTGLAYTPDPLSGNIIGVPRNLKKWYALNGQELEAFGSGYKAYVLNNYAVYDITPQRRQATLTAAFSTVNGSQLVTVIDYNHGAITGDYVYFSAGTAVGGISLTATQFGAGPNAALLALNQHTVGGTPMTLTVSPYVMPAPRFVTLYSTSDFSAINFTIVGHNQETGANWSEVLTGPAAGKSVQSTKVYGTVVSITPSTTLAQNISAGFPFAPGEYQLTTIEYRPNANVAVSQALATSTIMTLTTTPFVMAGTGYLSITSATNISGITFTIVGLDVNGSAQSETILGPNASTITSALAYSSVTSVTPNSNAGSASIGNFFPTGSAYTIEAAMKATSTAVGGGTTIANYDINAGLDSVGWFYGWGSGTWGQSTWGTPRAGGTSTMVQPVRLWSMDNWGQNLMASPRGGNVYYWQYDLGFTTKAANISQVAEQGTTIHDGPPTSNQRILVSADEQQLVCLGSNHDGVQDPLYVITSDNADYTNFTTTPENNVYDARLSSGSYIMTGTRTRTGVLIHTDISTYLMAPSQDTNVYSMTQIGENTTLISANAVVENNGTVYWMGDRKFCMYDGIIQEIPCDIWTHVYDNVLAAKLGYGGISMANFDKVTAWYNDKWSEIWWFYPSFAATENDSYCIYNYKERHWTYGSFDRTAGCTTSSFYGAPLSIDQNGAIWMMEKGLDQLDVNGVTTAIQPFIKSYDFQVMDGAEVAHFSRAVPDNLDLTGTMYMQVSTKRYPNDAYKLGKPFTITQGVDKSDFRARGKLVSFNFYSTAAGSNWRMGFWSFEVQSDGER